MASSSSSRTQNDYNSNPLKGPQSQLIEGSKDWLELGLGFRSSSASTKVLTFNGSTSSSSSSSPSLALHQANDQQKPAVGSELGFHHHHDHDGMSSSSCMMFTSWPLNPSSSSPPSCMPLHTDSSTDAVGLHYPLIKPQCGLWFMLLSSINRNGEVLPQIPKPYIRVKDEKVTVFMVKTYLVTKLGLSNEAEIEITCMGQKLLLSQTLKNVRDSIWLPTTIFLNPSRSRPTPLIVMPSTNANSMKYLMPLEYRKKCAF